MRKISAISLLDKLAWAVRAAEVAIYSVRLFCLLRRPRVSLIQMEREQLETTVGWRLCPGKRCVARRPRPIILLKLKLAIKARSKPRCTEQLMNCQCPVKLFFTVGEKLHLLQSCLRWACLYPYSTLKFSSKPAL